MTRIFLLSDTHGHMDERILHYAAKADEIWHAGDMGSLEVCDQLQEHAPLRGVYGNIDGEKVRREYREELFFQCEEALIYMIHIGGYPGRYSPKARLGLDRRKADLFISGHSHILKVINDPKRKLLHMNPGACGQHGFHQMRTALQFVVDGKEFKELQVIEFGKRGKIK
jgi:putative phosphoesterase